MSSTLHRINDKTTRIDYFDILKGLAIFFVVQQHLLNIFDSSSALFMILRYMHMPVFFFVSGYFSRNSIKKLSFGQLIYEKAMRFGVPYVLWTFIATIAKWIMNRNLIFTNTLVDNLLFSRSVWYLIAVFISYILLKIIVSRNYLHILVILIILIPVKIDFLVVSKIQELFIFFYLGYIVSSQFSLNYEAVKIAKIAVLPLLLVSILLLPIIYSISQENWLLYLGSQIVGDFVGLLLILTIGIIINQASHKIFCKLGLYSLDIYCIHMFFINIASVTIFKGINNHFEIYSFVIAVFICILSYFSSNIFIRRSKLFTKLLLGEKLSY